MNQSTNVKTLKDCKKTDEENPEELMMEIMKQLRETSDNVLDLEEKNEAFETLLIESRTDYKKLEQKANELEKIVDNTNETKLKWASVSELLKSEADIAKNKRFNRNGQNKYYDELKEKHW